MNRETKEQETGGPEATSGTTIRHYRAKTEISIVVETSDGSRRRVRFLPTYDGGSRLITPDPELQLALECHRGFGSLFELEEEREEREEMEEKETRSV